MDIVDILIVLLIVLLLIGGVPYGYGRYGYVGGGGIIFFLLVLVLVLYLVRWRGPSA